MEDTNNFNEEDIKDWFENDFDTHIKEIKNILKISIKKEIKTELENLRKENKELLRIKENFEFIQNDYENRIERLKRKYQNAKLSELLDDYTVTLYSVSQKGLYKKKCGNCDDRIVKVTLPSGKITNDVCCECGIPKILFYPKKYILYDLYYNNDKISAYYSQDSIGEKEGFHFEKIKAENIIKDDEKVEDIIKFENQIFFHSLEKCKEYCDYLNQVDWKDEDKNEYKYEFYGDLDTEKE